MELNIGEARRWTHYFHPYDRIWVPLWKAHLVIPGYFELLAKVSRSKNRKWRV